MTPRRHISAPPVVLAIAAAALAASAVAVSAPATTTTTPTLNAIRAAHHPGFDRVVFQFAGAVPSRRNLRYVARLLADPSGAPVPIAGRAILQVSFSPASGHDSAGHATTARRMTFALPNVMAVVRSGDFESVLSFGIGLAQRGSIHAFTLTRPSRVVIDIATPSRTVTKRVFFFNTRRFAANTPPFLTAVQRPVLAITPAGGLMDRLFAGPIPSEAARGLKLLSSRATGFTGLSIVSGVAKLRLTGGCSSGGSTESIAQEITATLKQLSTVRFVKIYDPAGHTERPSGARDSIPTCLEP